MNVEKRLRASKTRSNNARFDHGMTLGRKWAEDSAEADELEQLARWRGGFLSIDHVADALLCDADDLIGSALVFGDDVIDHVALYCPYFAAGFVAGALTLMAEHLDVFGLPAEIVTDAIDGVIGWSE